MTKSIEQVEKNTQASFGYVKKDLLMLNDAVSDIHDKIQHLSMNHATLLNEIEKLKKEINIKKKPQVKKVKTIKKQPAKKKTSVKSSIKKSPSKVIKTEEIVY